MLNSLLLAGSALMSDNRHSVHDGKFFSDAVWTAQPRAPNERSLHERLRGRFFRRRMRTQKPSIPSLDANPLTPRLPPCEPEETFVPEVSWTVHDGQYFADALRRGRAQCPNERRALKLNLGAHGLSCRTVAREERNVTKALTHALQTPDVAEIRALLKSGAVSVNTRLENGWTPLMYASSLGHKMAVVELLQRGADHSLKQGQGCTALMFASMVGSLPIVDLLLVATADPKATDSQGLSATMYASLKGHGDVISRLLLAGGETRSVTARREMEVHFKTVASTSAGSCSQQPGQSTTVQAKLVVQDKPARSAKGRRKARPS